MTTRTPAAGLRTRGDRGWVGVASAAVGTGLAASTFWSVFSVDALLAVVVPASALGLAVALLAVAVRSRVPFLAFMALGPTLALVGAGVGARSAAPSLVFGGFVDGAREMLSGPLPADDDPLARAALGAFVAVAALTGGLAGRRRSPGFAVAPAAAVAVVGLASGVASAGPHPGAVAVAAAGIGLALVGLRQNAVAAGRRGSELLRTVTALVLVAVAVVTGVMVSAAVDTAPRDERFSLRSLVREPPADIDRNSPLDDAAVLLGGRDRTVASARFDALGVARLPFAVLDTFDGEVWTADEQLEVVGERVGVPADQPGGRTRRITQDLRLEEWPSRWLPHLDGVTSIGRGAPLARTVRSGRLVARAEIPARLEVESSVAQPMVGRDVGFANDAEARRAMRLPRPVPSEVVDQVRAARSASPAPRRVLDELIRTFRTGLRATEPGSDGRAVFTWASVSCLLQGQACDRAGTRLQIAAAFVLVARAARIPTRLVVGVPLAPSRETHEIRAHAVTAWAEVRIAGVGWVTIDPVPREEVDAAPPTAARSGAGPVIGGDDSRRSSRSSPGTVSRLVATGRDRPWIPVTAAVALLVLALPAVLRGVRRRRRRRRPHPQDRLYGAWAEIIDELRSRGLRSATSATVTEVAARAARVVTAAKPDAGDRALEIQFVATSVNALAFGRRGPGSDVVEQAWGAADRLRGSSSPRPRMVAAIRRYWRLGPVLRPTRG